MTICFFEGNRQMTRAATFPARARSRPSGRSPPFSGRTGGRGVEAPGPRPLSQGRTLILDCISRRSPGVSWSNEIFSGEGRGAPVSGGIDCSGAAPDWHSPSECNSPIVSPPLSVGGQNKEGKWLAERRSKCGQAAIRRETRSFGW